MWVPTPADIQTFRAHGTGDMGSLVNRYSLARFKLNVPTWCLVYVKAHFASGTGSATLTLYQDHHDEAGTYDITAASMYDFILRKWLAMGTTGTADVAYRVPNEELPGFWTFHAGDELVFTWTNPNSGTMRWSLEVGLTQYAA